MNAAFHFHKFTFPPSIDLYRKAILTLKERQDPGETS